eukprot:13274030-Alexandrium_andersonii.AAC.1
MSASLVGSEMCIRDRAQGGGRSGEGGPPARNWPQKLRKAVAGPTSLVAPRPLWPWLSKGTC